MPRLFLQLLILLPALASCGQTGPLYHPAETGESVPDVQSGPVHRSDNTNL